MSHFRNQMKDKLALKQKRSVDQKFWSRFETQERRIVWRPIFACVLAVVIATFVYQKSGPNDHLLTHLEGPEIELFLELDEEIEQIFLVSELSEWADFDFFDEERDPI